MLACTVALLLLCKLCCGRGRHAGAQHSCLPKDGQTKGWRGKKGMWSEKPSCLCDGCCGVRYTSEHLNASI